MGYDKSAFGFQDLEVYQEARKLRKVMYEVAKSLPVEERFALGQQVRRAAVSLTNNMAEGYGRFNWQETTQFFRHARGSLMELVDDMSVCEDEQYTDEATLAALHSRAESVLRLINGYIRYLQKEKAGS